MADLRPLSLPSQKNVLISFKPKVAIAKFVWKMQKKPLVLWKLVWTPCLFPPRLPVKQKVFDSQPGKSCLDSDMKWNFKNRMRHKRRNTSSAKNSLYFLCTLQTIHTNYLSFFMQKSKLVQLILTLLEIRKIFKVPTFW